MGTPDLPDRRTSWSVTELADRWGVTVDTVRGWIKDGRLDAYRLGGTGPYRVPAEAADAWEVRPTRTA